MKIKTKNIFLSNYGDYFTTVELPTRFSKDNDGIILDNFTGLKWLVGENKNINHYDALKWVKKLGHNWRLPTIKELKSLYDENKITSIDNDIHINPIFLTDWKYCCVWSSELLNDNNKPSQNSNAPRARSFGFNGGYDFSPPRDDSGYERVFAVRR